MSVRAAWLLVALAACAHEGAESPEPAPAPAPAPTPTPVPAPVPIVTLAPDAAPATPDDAFRAAVRTFAARADGPRAIAAWGTLHLDGSDKPYRYATLNTLQGPSWELTPGAADTGVYIVEQAPDLYWAIGYWWTAAGFQTAEVPSSGEPDWTALPDTAIAHAEMHNHGKSHTTIALRDQRWVVLHEDDYNSRHEPDTVEHTYVAADGSCKHCPTLAKHRFSGSSLLLWWPAHSIAELATPTLDMMNVGDISSAPGPDVDHVVPISTP